MIVWKVSIDGRGCVFESYKEARSVYVYSKLLKEYEDYKVVMYPIFMRRSKFENLKEFTGW